MTFASGYGEIWRCADGVSSKLGGSTGSILVGAELQLTSRDRNPSLPLICGSTRFTVLRSTLLCNCKKRVDD